MRALPITLLLLPLAACPQAPDFEEETIGAAGGTISLPNGPTLRIPAGALATPVKISITRTDREAPADYTALSPVFALEPDGLLFAKPVEVSLDFDGTADSPALYWSNASGGYDRITALVVGQRLTAQVEHFCGCFAGDRRRRPDAGFSTADAGHPSADAAALESDASQSGADAAFLEFDASQPGADAAFLEVDASQPGADAAQPTGDATVVQLDASQPAADAALSAEDASSIGADAASPTPDADLAGADAASSVQDAALAGLDAATSAADAALTGLDAGSIVADASSPPVMVAIVVQPSNVVLQKGATSQLSALGQYSDTTIVDLTGACTWGSDDFGIATVAGGLVTGVSLGTATVTASFDGLTGSASVVVEGPSLVHVAIAPPNAVLRPNLIYPYRAYAVYADQTVVEVPRDAALWTIDNTSVVEMYGYSYFGIWAKDAGLTPLYVNYGGSMGNSRVQVLNSSITGLEATPGKVILPAGTAARMSGVFAYKGNGDGWAVAVPNPTWSSSDESIVKVSADGVATAYAAGTASITCTAYDATSVQTTSVPVTVTSATIASIDLSVPSTLVVGLSARARATGTFSDGAVVDLEPSAVFWSVSDSSLASIVRGSDGTTTVLAKAAGTVGLSATFGSVTATASVQLVSTTLSSLSLAAVQTSLAQGSTSRLTVTGHFADGTEMDLTDSATYDSLAPDVAQIATGVFTAMPWPMIVAHAPNQAPQTGTVRASFQGQSATQDVTVIGANLRSLAVGVNGGAASSSSITLTGGGPFQLNVVGTFTDNSTADVTAFCTFEPASFATGVVATVSNSKVGQVTLLGKGTQTLKVTYAPSYIGQPLITASLSMTVQ